jgi:hypothetical protein
VLRAGLRALLWEEQGGAVFSQKQLEAIYSPALEADAEELAAVRACGGQRRKAHKTRKSLFSLRLLRFLAVIPLLLPVAQPTE